MLFLSCPATDSLQSMAEFTYKALNAELSPPYMKTLVTIYKPASCLNSTEGISLVFATARITVGECEFVTASETVYNALPTTVTSKLILISFKAAPKAHLFITSYTDDPVNGR